eukprot:gnl/Spiro4/8497_TR4463_c0_g1_i1.p1 gnl/Spiro4/8497_TR4463_c0_g1~~gnl/Spiro4/8497_TR4463_c0_g1_i1.p1  ORF type:complete len:233 (+),score=61.34 gnl/Spiro4/8497_TR4463_c0_g1_i1:30-701(+)
MARPTMDDKRYSEQIKQMVQWIRNDAASKIREISVEANNAYDRLKREEIQNETEKLEIEYKRKMDQVNSDKKVAHSTEMNAVRIIILKKQQELLQRAKDTALAELRTRVADRTKYRALLSELIFQGLEKLQEDSVNVMVRVEDVSLAQELIPALIARYQTQYEKPVAINILQEHLPAGPACAGGAVLASTNGQIVVSNTIEARLEIAFHKYLPELRKHILRNN